jgi:WD40 repeat protein
LSVAFSPNGKRIISGLSDATLYLWDVASGQAIEFPIKGHTDMVTSIALSPDRKKIVSASVDNTVCVWHAQTGQLIGSPLKGDITGVISLAFSPDWFRFAAASLDNTICLWETESHNRLASYRNDCIKNMSFITFSSDGRHLTTSSIDGTTHTWDATNKQPISTSKLFDITSSESSKPLAFTIEQGWRHEEPDQALLLWFSVDNPDFGHWAYIHNKLIRTDRSGLTTIMDMSEVERKWKTSLDGQEADKSA